MKIQNKIRYRVAGITTSGLITVFGMIGSAWGACAVDPAASATILVDATTACSNLSQTGCRIDGDSGSCNFNGTTVTVSRDNNDGITWIAEGDNGVNWILVGGATGGGACGTGYEPVATSSSTLGGSFEGLGFRKSNGTFANITYVEACSKLEAPPPPPLPNLVLSKTVTTAGGSCGSDDSELLSVNVPASVKYCYEIENTGGSAASDIILSDDNGTPGNPSDDFTITLFDSPDAELAPGATVLGESDDIIISAATTIVNVATVSGVDTGGNTLPVRSDTATVSAQEPELQLPLCPPDVQEALDDDLTGLGFDDVALAITYEFNDDLGVISSLCVKGSFEGTDLVITECQNQPGLDSSSGDLPLCSEVLSPEGNILRLTNLNTYVVAGAVGSSCAFTCLPPPLTFGGGGSCAWICR